VRSTPSMTSRGWHRCHLCPNKPVRYPEKGETAGEAARRHYMEAHFEPWPEGVPVPRYPEHVRPTRMSTAAPREETPRA
jgi:hypothetical protein